jgi:type III secretion protein L
MSFLAIHRTRHTSLATDRPWLNPDEWTACDSAVAMLERLHELHASQSARLAAEVAQARTDGFAVGRSEALRSTGDTLVAAWQQAAEQAQVDAQALRDAVVALSLQIVQRIAADLAPHEVVAALAQRAAEERMPDQAAIVRVHPDVLDAVQARLETSPALTVRADPSLSPLDCVFETPTGQLLAGLSTQLDRVAQALHAGSRGTAA